MHAACAPAGVFDLQGVPASWLRQDRSILASLPVFEPANNGLGAAPQGFGIPLPLALDRIQKPEECPATMKLAGAKGVDAGQKSLYNY